MTPEDVLKRAFPLEPAMPRPPQVIKPLPPAPRALEERGYIVKAERGVDPVNPDRSTTDRLHITGEPNSVIQAIVAKIVDKVLLRR